jgi:agmatine/peptidylarginine deiminase
MKKKSVSTQQVNKTENSSKRSENFSTANITSVNSHSVFDRFGLDRILYSVIAVIIFFSGLYVGTKYLPAGINKENSSYHSNSQTQNRKSGIQRTTTQSFSEPEDFFPAAEFRKQSAILIGCQNNLNKSPQLYIDIAQAVNRKVPLIGIVPTEIQALDGAAIMKQNGLHPDAMRFLVIPSNSIWIRDYAPFILRYDHGKALLIDGKYQTRNMREKRAQDDFFAMELGYTMDLPVRSIPLLMEGGNILSNGDGMMLTSGKTIAMNEHNGNFSPKQIMTMFNDYMGARSVYSFAPLVDEPNGHIDMFVTLVDKNIAVVGQLTPGVDPESSAHLDETANTLASLNTTVGPMKVVRIPMPPKSGSDWRSYTNVIMANKLLLMPSFSDVDPSIEDKAESVYRSVLPSDWDIQRINCDKLVPLNGQLHCISYNIPSFVNIDSLLNRSITYTQNLAD